MSYHSSALPIDVATISLVMFFFTGSACDSAGTSTCAEMVMPNPSFGFRQRAWHLAQIPEQARHDAQRLLGDRQQNVLVGRVLGTTGIGVRHPHRGQSK